MSPSPSRYRREQGEPMKRLKRNRIQRASIKAINSALPAARGKTAPF